MGVRDPLPLLIRLNVPFSMTCFTLLFGGTLAVFPIIPLLRAPPFHITDTLTFNDLLPLAFRTYLFLLFRHNDLP